MGDMGKGLAGFVSNMSEREGGKFTLKQSNPLDKIQDVVPHLKMLVEDPASCSTIPAEKLKAMADMKLVDVVVNERGRRICETFREIEELTKPTGFSTRDEEGKTRHYLVEQVSAAQGAAPQADDNIKIAKSTKSVKSQYM